MCYKLYNSLVQYLETNQEEMFSTLFSVKNSYLLASNKKNINSKEITITNLYDVTTSNINRHVKLIFESDNKWDLSKIEFP